MARSTKRNCIRTLGKENYGFNFEAELEGYKFLCGRQVNRKSYMLLINDARYSSYDSWSRGIQERYKQYPKEYLTNFSRYLNQCIRNIEPSTKTWDIFVPVLIALFLENTLDVILKFEGMEFEATTFKEVVSFAGVCMFALLGVLALVGWCINAFIKPIWEKDIEKNFLYDYKKEIDKLI